MINVFANGIKKRKASHFGFESTRLLLEIVYLVF